MSYNNQFDQSGLPFIGDSRRPYSASHTPALDGRHRSHVRFNSSEVAPRSTALMGDALQGGMTDLQAYPSSQVQVAVWPGCWFEILLRNSLVHQLHLTLLEVFCFFSEGFPVCLLQLTPNRINKVAYASLRPPLGNCLLHVRCGVSTCPFYQSVEVPHPT